MTTTTESSELLPTGKQAAVLIKMCEGWLLHNDYYHFALTWGEKYVAGHKYECVFTPTVIALRKRGLIAPPARLPQTLAEVRNQDPWTVTEKGREVGALLIKRRERWNGRNR